MEQGLSQEFLKEFKNPGNEYRGTPFWSWNTKLDPDCLEEQIEQFREMGMGGFYIHTRVGLDTEYMGPEYMDCVKKAVKIAKEKGLFACLYDEDRWPSGYGGGKVTSRREYRSRNLLITPYRKGTKSYTKRNTDSMASPSPQGNGTFLAAYEVGLNTDGTLAFYDRCGENAVPKKGGRLWYVYLEIAHDSPWFNNQSYVDTLNPEAIRCFLDVTYEAYKHAVGEEFGHTIPSIFTDEPQFGRKNCLGNAAAMEEVMLPFTDDFWESYSEAYGEDLLDYIPELIWELPNGAASRHRYRYHDHVTERFARAFSDQVGEWCDKEGLCLAGHMMEEPTLQSQTQALGEVMKSLRGFSLPGIDMLCDAREYTTAKQAESVCHQYGRAGVVSELYGVTNWDFDFRNHKLQGDWQAALGITHRVHHLNWMSMGGEAKRDYPAAIGFQSPWYKEYGCIETHFARVNTAMRKGIPEVHIGVIHPVESLWLLFGPNQQTSQKRQELDRRFSEVTKWLLFNQLDFDFISESLLAEQWDGVKVGRMNYDTVVVPGCLTLRQTTLDILKEMREAGRKIIFMGKVPKLVDACKSRQAVSFAEKCTRIEFEKGALLEELEEFRFLEIRYHGEKHLKKPWHKKNWNGERAEKYLCQTRVDGEARWLFIANGRKESDRDLTLSDDVRMVIKGSWQVTELDTMDGAVRKRTSYAEDGDTVLYHRFYQHDSLLLYLEPKEWENSREIVEAEKTDDEKACVDTRQEMKVEPVEAYVHYRELFQDPVEVVREEPNVLLLDLPEYRFAGQSFEGPEEILRVDNILRERLGLPLRRAALAQPWTQKEEGSSCPVALRYRIHCGTEIRGAFLALEALEETEIYVDEQQISPKAVSGFYVDPCIRMVRLPVLSEGTHELRLEIAFQSKVNLECCYLLGDFSVVLSGSHALLERRKTRSCWSSLTEQGMPFYGGNAVYRTELDLEKGDYLLEVSKYRAPLLEVRVDSEKAGSIITAPYRVHFQIRHSGKHCLEVKSFGSRVNTFGAVHNCDENEIYFDPNAWRTTNESWSYEYQLKKTGILKAPVIWKRKLGGKA